MREYVECALRTAVAVVAAVLCSFSPAQAASFRGKFDPQYGFPFELDSRFNFDLGWRGEALFEVDDDCVPTSSGVVFFLPSNDCGTAAVQSAYVELYAVNDYAPPGGASYPAGTTLEKLSFDASSMKIGALRFEGSELEGLFTSTSNFLPSTFTSNANVRSFFSLAFVDFVPDVSEIFEVWPVLGNYSGPLLISKRWMQKCTRFGCYWVPDINLNNVSGEGPYELTFSINRVPEPGGLALVTGALLAAGWVARSRRRMRLVPPAITGR